MRARAKDRNIDCVRKCSISLYLAFEELLKKLRKREHTFNFDTIANKITIWTWSVIKCNDRYRFVSSVSVFSIHFRLFATRPIFLFLFLLHFGGIYWLWYALSWFFTEWNSPFSVFRLKQKFFKKKCRKCIWNYNMKQMTIQFYDGQKYISCSYTIWYIIVKFFLVFSSN